MDRTGTKTMAEILIDMRREEIDKQKKGSAQNKAGNYKYNMREPWNRRHNNRSFTASRSQAST